MKRILINATHNEEVRVALCKDSHLYDFDLENRTREQKKANIYKGHITRVEPSLEAVFVEYGSARQGFLPLREIAPEYLKGNTRTDNIRDLIKEGDEVIIQVEKEERGNKGAAVSTYISLAGRYLVLMPNNSKGGGISRQISGKVREEMKQIIASLSIPKGMSVIVRTAGIGKGFDDLQNDLNHLLDIWSSIQEQNRTRPSPCLVHQEAGVVTRAVRDYLRDDIGEVWIDSEHAYNEAAHFIASVMPNQMSKLRKYTDYEPLFSRFGIERQIETAYQREVRLPSGGSIVIDQTEAMVAIDINSAKSTKGSDVAETAYHTNLEAADEIARQLRLRDMGGLIVIDFIDMNDPRHQKDVEKRLIDATRYDRARVQFAEISKFGLMEMSRQRLRPSLDEATGYICPRCHGNGMIRDLRSLALSIMRQIEQIALKERMGEIQAEVPTEIAAFLLNEKRESLVYLEQDSGARITILPHAHLESPNFSLHFNPDGFAPSSYERIVDVEERESGDLGYDTNWHTKADETTGENRWQKAQSNKQKQDHSKPKDAPKNDIKPQAVAWLSNLFAPKPQAKLAHSLNTGDVAAAIESLVNDGAVSLGASGQLAERPTDDDKKPKPKKVAPKRDDGEKADAKPDTKAEPKTDTKYDKRPKKDGDYPKRDAGSQRTPRGEMVRGDTLKPTQKSDKPTKKEPSTHDTKAYDKADEKTPTPRKEKPARKAANPKDVVIHISHNTEAEPPKAVIHLSLDNSKGTPPVANNINEKVATNTSTNDVASVAVSDIQDQTTKADTPVISDAHDTAQHHHDDPSQIGTNAQTAQQETIKQSVSDQDTTVQTAKTPFGRAKNDPRVVMAAQPKIAITGTAGAFITKVLGERQGDFVADFLKAMDVLERPAIDFANYGYESLSAQYLLSFTQSITPDGQYQIPQGKTHATPPTSIRAKNDPRGQHEKVDITPPVAPTQDVMDTVNTPDVSDLPAKTADEMADVVTVDVIDVNLDVSTDTAHQAQDKATDMALDVQNVKNAQNTISDDTSAMPAATESAQTSDEPDDTDGDTAFNGDDDKSDDKKRLNSYKNMIETVSDQLLPQVGILNLVAAKKKTTKPKAPKIPSKKRPKPLKKQKWSNGPKPKNPLPTAYKRTMMPSPNPKKPLIY